MQNCLGSESMNVILIVGILIIAIVAVSAILIIQNVSVAPKSRLMQDITKLSGVNQVDVTYAINYSNLGSGTLPSNANVSLEIYKLGNAMKILISSASVYGTSVAAVYLENNFSVNCNQASYTGYYAYSGQLQCTSTPLKYFKSYGAGMGGVLNKTLNQMKISYGNQQTIIGRSCDSFLINLNSTGLYGIFNAIANFSNSSGSTLSYIDQGISQSLHGSNIRLGLCLDAGTGIPLSMNVSLLNYSSILGKNTTTFLFSMKAVNFSTQVSSSVFRIPVNFSVSQNVECTSKSVAFNLTSFINTTNDTVVVKVPEGTIYPGVYSDAVAQPVPCIGISCNMQQANATGIGKINSKYVTAWRTYNVTATLNTSLQNGFYYPIICFNGACQASSLGSFCYVNNSTSQSHNVLIQSGNLNVSYASETQNITMPKGSSVYMYLFSGGGLYPSTPFITGNYIIGIGADGQINTGLAITRNSSDSFSTQNIYYSIAGIGVSGYKYYGDLYRLNVPPIEPNTTFNFSFTLPEKAFVVFAVSSGGTQYTALNSSTPFKMIAANCPSYGETCSGGSGFEIATANLTAGTYNFSDFSTNYDSGSNTRSELIGVFAFSNSSAGFISNPVSELK